MSRFVGKPTQDAAARDGLRALDAARRPARPARASHRPPREPRRATGPSRPARSSTARWARAGQRRTDDERIGKVLVRGRRCGAIPWEAIGDSRTESALPFFYSGPDGFRASMRGAAERYRLDRQEGQERYLEVVVEARGAVEQVWRTTSPYQRPRLLRLRLLDGHVPARARPPGGGRDAPTTILVLGDDDDPSGIDIRSRVRGGHRGLRPRARRGDRRRGDRADGGARRGPGPHQGTAGGQEARALPLVAPQLDGRARGALPGGARQHPPRGARDQDEHRGARGARSTASRRIASSWSARSAARGPRMSVQPNRVGGHDVRCPPRRRPYALQELPSQARR